MQFGIQPLGLIIIRKVVLSMELKGRSCPFLMLPVTTHTVVLLEELHAIMVMLLPQENPYDGIAMVLN